MHKINGSGGKRYVPVGVVSASCEYLSRTDWAPGAIPFCASLAMVESNAGNARR